MRNADDGRWSDDLDRARATLRGVIGSWLVVAGIAGLMLIVPPTVHATDQALEGVKKIEHKIVQAVPQIAARTHRC